MPATIADLRKIYTTSRLDADLQPFVDAATLIETENLVDSGLTVARKSLISNWFAAHLLALSEQGGASRKRLGEADESYANDASNLASTPFGAQAMAFDTSGTLAALLTSSRLKAIFEVV